MISCVYKGRWGIKGLELELDGRHCFAKIVGLYS